MTKKQSRNSPDHPRNAPGEDYTIGYGKPPKETQFKKGESGNPEGRPKGSRNKPHSDDNTLSKLILDEGDRHITIQEAGKPITLSTMKTVIRSLYVGAAKGDVRAQKVLLDAYSRAEKVAFTEKVEFFEAATNYKAYWEPIIDRSLRTGEPSEDPPVHPSDIVLDYREGDVLIRELSSEDEGFRKYLSRRLRQLAREAKNLRRTAEKTDDHFKALRLSDEADEVSAIHRSLLEKFKNSHYLKCEEVLSAIA